jgi:hypothetical protein
VVRDELCHEVIAVAEPAASIALKRKAQSETKLVGIGGRQSGRIISHAVRLDQPREQIKNILRSDPCLSGSRSVMLTPCQTAISQPSMG